VNDTEQLWKNYWADRSIENRNALATAYVPWLWDMARRKRSRMPTSAQIEEGDLVGYGYLGLVDCIERFDPGRGLKFATFASTRINGAMVDGIRNEDWVPRLERVKEKKGEVVTNHMQSLVELVGFNDRGDEAFKQYTDPRQTVWSERQSLNDTLRGLTKGLSKSERIVLLLYYVEDLTMREIGTHLDLSESRVSQMHSAIILKIREAQRNRTRQFEKTRTIDSPIRMNA
jgi:RNA polymerase sigma factor for flagellar operon FliA